MKALIAEMDALLAQEMEAASAVDRAEFAAARCPVREVDVQFSGGIMQTCLAVTRSDGDYSVIWMPRAGYFSLCVDGPFGPLDIGVHGSALDCFNSV